VKESKDAKAKEQLRKEAFCGRLDRTINYARAIKYQIPCTNMLDGKGRRHGQHNTGFDTKTKIK
jgi:hypothetical protein